MKKIFNSLFIMAAVTAMVSTSSCTKVCDAGFEGSDCKTEVRTKYLATGANVTETCGGSPTSYVVDVVTGSEVTKIRIKNLGNYSCSTGDYYVTLTVGSDNTLTVDGQTTCATQWSGTGTYDATTKRLSVSYVATYGAGPTTDNCTAVIQL